MRQDDNIENHKPSINANIRMQNRTQLILSFYREYFLMGW